MQKVPLVLTIVLLVVGCASGPTGAQLGGIDVAHARWTQCLARNIVDLDLSSEPNEVVSQAVTAACKGLQAEYEQAAYATYGHTTASEAFINGSLKTAEAQVTNTIDVFRARRTAAARPST